MNLKPAYFYTRISSKAQISGEGINRQEDFITKFLDGINNNSEGNVQYIQSKIINDSGVSAYDGSNILDGELGKFIIDAENGKIEQGSLLILEALDRLSRQKISESRKLIQRIFDAGIKIAIVKYNIIFDDSSSNEIGADLLVTAGLHLAFMESEQKSVRLRDTFARKREKIANGIAVKNSHMPFWLTYENNNFTLLPEQVKHVKLIFKLRLEGMGLHSITRYFNENNLKLAGNKSNSKHQLNSTRVTDILKHRGVYGAYEIFKNEYTTTRKRISTGEIIENYYPVIISKEDFDNVQGMFEGKRNIRKVVNIFSGLTKCSCCGNNYGYFKQSDKQTFLRCASMSQPKNINEKCKNGSINYEKVILPNFINYFGNYDFRELLKDTNDNGLIIDLENKLNVKLDDKKKITKNKNYYDTLMSSYIENDDLESIDETRKTVLALSRKRQKINEDIKDIESKLVIFKRNADLDLVLNSIKDINKLDFTDERNRVLYNETLKRFIDKIELTKVKRSAKAKIHYKTGFVVELFLPHKEYEQQKFDSLALLYKAQDNAYNALTAFSNP
ncbi:recombinase family protein [Pseudoalteromonas sp. SWYJZ98]|uniref:recombinase family protein n=1 Tax=Pseudoalteromonas sp. SWYJZ98 TaxID=2792060 RepID=UPI0018CD27E0|nr:recombinase family protein [Pseudoalteromonas sp. SWYJZ98]MBH0030281.1 recombinase family protein [Pseudoalteromonas sp. SWYJZ98]